MKANNDEADYHLDQSLALGDQRFEMEKTLHNEALYLNDLSKALYMVGQNDLADNIRHSAKTIEQAAKDSQRIAVSELNVRLDDQKESAGAILTACLHAATK